MITQSNEIGALALALSKAQGVMKHAIKDSNNPHFKSKYADLTSCLEAVREPLSKHGLAIVQLPSRSAEGLVELTTMLIHESGQWIGSTASTRIAKDDAQGMGSALSYLRRYCLMSITGLGADDDDGEQAMNRHLNMRDDGRKFKGEAERIGQAVVGQTVIAAVHHASWPNARQAFCAILGDLGHDYAVVANWCESLGRARPSAMDNAQREKLLEFIKSEKGKTSITSYANV
jgi:hypothetical protein